LRFPSFATPIALPGRAQFGALTDTALVVDLKAHEAFGRIVTAMNINNAAERAADMLLCQASRS
jgi:hypothetical protein